MERENEIRWDVCIAGVHTRLHMRPSHLFMNHDKCMSILFYYLTFGLLYYSSVKSL